MSMIFVPPLRMRADTFALAFGLSLLECRYFANLCQFYLVVVVTVVALITPPRAFALMNQSWIQSVSRALA
eukprot:2417181-Pyramimonas_sp.AAC.1